MNFSKICKAIGIVCLCVACVLLLLRQITNNRILNQNHDYFPPVGEILAPSQNAFRFVIVGDTGHNAEVLTPVLKTALAEKPDFVIYIGDLVAGFEKEHFYDMTKVLEQAIDDTPIFFTPGNHDVTHRGSYKRHHDKTNYMHRLGNLHYWFGYGDTLFIALDSSNGTIDDAQWDFYAWTMRHIRPVFRRAILYTHIPPINPVDATEHKQNPESAEKMAAMIRKYKPDAIFTGHVHYYSLQKFQGVPLYSSPASGQSPNGDVREMGYLRVDVDRAGVKVSDHYVDGYNTPKYMSKSLRRQFFEVSAGDTPEKIVRILLIIALVAFATGWACTKFKV